MRGDKLLDNLESSSAYKKSIFTTEEINKLIESVKITNDLLFTSVASDKEIAVELIKLFTGIDLSKEEIDIINKEYTLDVSLKARGVRFDIYLAANDTIFDLEIQNANLHNLYERMRYYQGIIDVGHLKQGDDFLDLKTTYIIFICNFNPCVEFSSNKAIYTIGSFISDGEEYKLCNDKANKILVNTRCDIDAIQDNTLKSFIELIRDGYTSKTPSSLVDKIKSKVKEVKMTPEWRKEYMLEYERLEQARNEGREEGLAKGLINSIKLLKTMSMADDNVIIENVCEQFQVSEAEVIYYLNNINE